jgi:hypothetical protein
VLCCAVLGQGFGKGFVRVLFARDLGLSGLFRLEVMWLQEMLRVLRIEMGPCMGTGLCVYDIQGSNLGPARIVAVTTALNLSSNLGPATISVIRAVADVFCSFLVINPLVRRMRSACRDLLSGDLASCTWFGRRQYLFSRVLARACACCSDLWLTDRCLFCWKGAAVFAVLYPPPPPYTSSIAWIKRWSVSCLVQRLFSCVVM